MRFFNRVLFTFTQSNPIYTSLLLVGNKRKAYALAKNCTTELDAIKKAGRANLMKSFPVVAARIKELLTQEKDTFQR